MNRRRNGRGVEWEEGLMRRGRNGRIGGKEKKEKVGSERKERCGRLDGE